MKRKATTPIEVTEILALREAGYTVLAISQKLNLSDRTVHRHLATYGAKKGSLKEELIEQARNDLLKLVTSNPDILAEAAKQIVDDIAHSNHLRAILLEASAHLKATTLPEAVLVMRAAAAYSTAFKNTSDTIRHSLGADKIVDEASELPELIIKELSNEQIKEIAKETMLEED